MYARRVAQSFLAVFAGSIWLLSATSLCAHAAEFELAGQVSPETFVSVRLHGATAPFTAVTESDLRRRFRFPKLLAGTYTLIAMEPGHAELRQTVGVTPPPPNPRRQSKPTLPPNPSQAQSRPP